MKTKKRKKQRSHNASQKRLDIFIFRKSFFLTVVVVFISIAAVNYFYISDNASELLYDRVEDIPANEIGLLLGTGKYIDYPERELNPYYLARIAAASELYKAGKVKKILASGSNVINDFDELKAMKESLIKNGVNEGDIIIDQYGDRTLYSIFRAKKVFNLNKLTVISQKFHNERALFLSKHIGVEALAYNANAIGGWHAAFMSCRESLARLLMLADLYIFNTEPESLKI